MVFVVDIFSKIFDGVEITDDDENSTILSEFKFSPLVHIHKVTISWPKFPALGRRGSRGRMKRVTSKGCENIENCLHDVKDEGSGYKWIWGLGRHHKEIYIVRTWHLLWILRLALTGICMEPCPHQSWGKYWNWWHWSCSKVSLETETMAIWIIHSLLCICYPG